MSTAVLLVISVSSAIITGLTFHFLNSRTGRSSPRDSEPSAVPTVDVSKESAVIEAKAKAKELVLEAKDEALKIKDEAEKQAEKIRQEVLQKEKRLEAKESELENREKELHSKRQSIESARENLEKKKSEVERMHAEQKGKLENIASLTRDEAQQQLLQSFDKDLVQEKGKRIKQMEEEIKKDVEERSKEILIDAMRYGATDYVVEYTVSKVKLPDEDMKGRIIGKEGRNIRAFEEVTGVELELDSTPGEVLISSFDPVRREVAKVSLERLIADGRIQPAKIEEVVEKTKKEIEHIMYKEGDNLCHRVGVYDLPKDIVQMLGRFKYRFSYGQNMIEHTLEETRIGMAIAHEIGADVEVVKMGCLLHDIGKVVTDEEGTHVQVGVDLLNKYNIRDDVVACVAEHHEDKPFSSIESMVVNLADHISGARPGARSEDYESYVKRMKDLEDAAKSFDGIENAYAISAGREVRVFVEPEKVDDASTALLAREIAKKIELEQTYPGVVKVTVVRETRVSETAK